MIITPNPLKQGLKLSVDNENVTVLFIITPNPLKQGLKQFSECKLIEDNE